MALEVRIGPLGTYSVYLKIIQPRKTETTIGNWVNRVNRGDPEG